MSNLGVGHVHDIKSSKFADVSMFSPRKENIDDMFKAYFSRNTSDDSFVDLHRELHGFDLKV